MDSNNKLLKPTPIASSSTLICLCLTALTLSAPLNGISPALSLVAQDMGFDEKERDIYLGSYIALATMLGQMIGSCLSGLLADIYSRKRIIVIILVVGSITTTAFGVPIASFTMLCFLRVMMGGCQGFMVPILFSLLGDYYAVDRRPTISAVVSSCLGGGMMLGQLFAGFTLGVLGWRGPFIVIGMTTLATAIYVNSYLFDPVKGGNEEDLVVVLNRGGTLPSMTIATFFKSLCIPTVVLMLVQTVPNTIPWGVLSVHLHDFMATDAKLTMQQATSLMAIFGAGAALGGLCGGFVGALVYSYSKKLLPVLMGATLASAAMLLKEIIILDLNEPGAMQFAIPVLVLAGALAAVNGANVRVVVLNLTTPEARGASIALLNFVNGIGRGFGPLIIEKWMTMYSINRRDAIGTILLLWLFSGVLLCCGGITIAADEEKLKQQFKRIASQSNLNIQTS